VGKNKAMLKQLQSTTHTSIQVSAGSDVVEIQGQSPAAVLAASHRIQTLMNDLLCTMAPTHFLCIPLNTQALAESLASFHERVAAKSATWRDFSPRLAASAASLHLTVFMLTLPTQGGALNWTPSPSPVHL
jgi:AKAP7 2'5' RNA ligase-like domain/KH domain